MKHPRVAAGVFIPTSLFILLLLLPALGGCSLFGIATTGKLNDLAEKQETDNQTLQTELTTSQQQTDARVTEVEGKTAQLDADLVRYETKIQAALVELQAIKLDLETFEEELGYATHHSKEAMRLHHEAVIGERDRLRQRLNELDTLILTWQEMKQAAPAGTITPVPGGLMVPEKKTTTQGSADTASASNATSIWDKKQSGGN